eukprot:GHRR01037775.1.p1 GENE.GHRR01037775.1~~GHRR01037775.1.p1  ORF type:complete len:107 (-),score=25.87 GHRR01037775.1:724-1044(-)
MDLNSRSNCDSRTAGMDRDGADHWRCHCQYVDWHDSRGQGRKSSRSHQGNVKQQWWVLSWFLQDSYACSVATLLYRSAAAVDASSASCKLPSDVSALPIAWMDVSR